MRTSIYVAGASSERKERAEKWMARLRAEGFGITLDWSAIMARVQEEIPGGDDKLDRKTQEIYAHQDASGVAVASVVWILASKETASPGSWIEMGLAIGWNMALSEEQEPKRIGVSGSGSERTLFTTLADKCFATDEEAFGYLLTEFPPAKVRNYSHER